MIRFSCALESVSDKIRALPSEERQQAKAAFKYLKKCEVSEYKGYHARHVAFLTRHRGNPTESQARRPLHFIEEAGLETALWPHLYWETAMCESFERLTDRRLNQLDGRKRARRTYGDDDSASEDEEEAEEDEEKEERRHSIKRSFQTKLLSPLLGYGNDFQLLQYVYDLHLWTDLGSKRNQADRLGGHAMRLMMKGRPMSPLYWSDLKYALFDLVRQLGFPHLYWTLAPYERSYPYHNYLLDEMSKLLCARMRLPTFEVMHMAHTMFQICRGLLAGQGQAKGVGWTRHVLGQPEVAEAKLQPRVHFFTRLEFQDGSKKVGTQRYHGSGRPHVHALFWAQDIAGVALETKASATQDWPPEETHMQAYVRGSQLDQHGDSRWPLHEEPSAFGPVSGKVQLHHTQDDATAGVRAFFPDVLDALRCHQDLQLAQGRGLLLQYVTKYVAKWSDSSYGEWLSDSASVTSLCRKVLFEYHPLEPEMVLQLTQATFRQWEFGTCMGGRRPFRPPRADQDEVPQAVELYMSCTWRRESMSLLEFLRKSNARGGIARWLVKLYAQAAARPLEDLGQEPASLEAFANDYVMQGEQIVGVDYLWRLNDHFYGQWCVMHIPFRSMERFRHAEVNERVPPRYRWLATALCLTDAEEANIPRTMRGYWRDGQRQAEGLYYEGANDPFIQDVGDFVSAAVLAVDGYLSGHLGRREEEAAAAADEPQHRHRHRDRACL